MIPENDLLAPPLTTMEKAARAFAILGEMVRLRGRRLQAAQLRNRWRPIIPEKGNSAREAKMAPRQERRKRVKEMQHDMAKRLTEAGVDATEAQKKAAEGIKFRPVYGHAIPAPDHKLFIAALKTRDLDIATEWYSAQTDPMTDIEVLKPEEVAGS